MYKSPRSVLYGLVLTLTVALTACGVETPVNPTATTRSSSGPTPTGVTGQPTTSPTSDAPANPTSTSAGPTTSPVGTGNATIINVTVTGGPHAGTYEVRSSEATCSFGLVGADGWGNQYSDPDVTTGLSSLQLIVPSGREAANGTSNFNATFTFGEMLSDTATNYKFEGREGYEKEGDGTVTVTGGTDRATVRIQGSPAGGVEIDATMQCNEVFKVTSQATPTPDPGRLAAAGIEVTLQGGDTEGTFNVIGGEGTCGYGPNNTSILIEGLEEDQKNDAWTVEYDDDQQDDNLYQFWLLVPSTRDAAGGTDRFYLEINDQDYYIDNLEGDRRDGTGTVTVGNNGDTGVVTVDATTDDGATIKATITCHQVSR